jgi:hypothetical protein
MALDIRTDSIRVSLFIGENLCEQMNLHERLHFQSIHPCSVGFKHSLLFRIKDSRDNAFRFRMLLTRISISCHTKQHSGMAFDIRSSVLADGPLLILSIIPSPKWGFVKTVLKLEFCDIGHTKDGSNSLIFYDIHAYFSGFRFFHSSEPGT